MLTDTVRSEHPGSRRAGRRNARPKQLKKQGLRTVARDQGPAVGAARGARLPQPDRQAVLHSVGIDDAGPAHRRPAGGQQISLWLVLGEPELPRPAAADRAGCSAAMPERGDIVIVTPPGTAHRLYQARDRPARRHAADGRRRSLFINGQPVKRQTLSRATMIPIDINSPCGSSADPRTLTISASSGPDGKQYCRVPVVRETLPNGRTYETDRARPLERGQFRPGHRARRPCLADGRQSRRQRRQPRSRMAGRPRRPGAVGEYRRPRRVHHLLARRHRPCGGTR